MHDDLPIGLPSMSKISTTRPRIAMIASSQSLCFFCNGAGGRAGGRAAGRGAAGIGEEAGGGRQIGGAVG